MKRLSLLLFACGLSFLSSCDGFNEQPFPTTVYKPVLMDRSSLERSILWKPATGIKTPGKIYFKDNYILISERYLGVHLVDNTDPKIPVMKGYISVPGCVDMAMKDNTLYVDNAVDLVAIDISQIANGKIEVKKRVKETFPELIPPDGLSIPYKYSAANRPKNTVIVNWSK
ncbi:MAG: hypothetical protein WKF66_17685 [Pedobacter sp.]